MADETTPPRSVRLLLRRLARDQDGVAAVEFALLTPFLILLAVCTIDLGMGFHRKMQVQSAADAGAAAAAITGFDEQVISRAITSATPLAVAADPAPRKFCGCPDDAGISEVACTIICTGPAPAGTYVSASAHSTYTPIFPYPLIGSLITLRTTAVVRIQ
ncbi:MAG: pilus assembly protein [Prosthecobacter sp.]|nr:pilus assembly protein [Prosthecobacter sp.]